MLSLFLKIPLSTVTGMGDNNYLSAPVPSNSSIPKFIVSQINTFYPTLA